jgi:hypothetical protein
MSEVEIIVDGSRLGNPGPGGWACILRFGDDERVSHGGTPETTNNRIELSGAIEGLRALNRGCRVTVLTGTMRSLSISLTFSRDSVSTGIGEHNHSGERMCPSPVRSYGRHAMKQPSGPASKNVSTRI